MKSNIPNSILAGRKSGKTKMVAASTPRGSYISPNAARMNIVMEYVNLGLISRDEALMMIEHEIDSIEKLRKFMKIKDTPLYKVLNGQDGE